MNNLIFVVGTIEDASELFNQNEHSTEAPTIIIAIKRPFKNLDGKYENDYVACTLLTGLGMSEYSAKEFKKGRLISAKGRIQTKIVDGKRQMVFATEKVSFLSANKEHSVEKTNNDLEI